jgi:hypothetical protein
LVVNAARERLLLPRSPIDYAIVRSDYIGHITLASLFPLFR